MTKANEGFIKGVPGLERTVADDVMNVPRTASGVIGQQNQGLSAGPPVITMGRTVWYTMTADDSLRVGPPVAAGQEFPMIITHVHENRQVNGQVIPDGPHALWVKNVTEGTGPGTWRWPPRT
jgi:hypothetical protein